MVKRNKIAGIFSIIFILILLCTSIFVPFFNTKTDKVFAEEGDKSLYAFVSKQADKAINGKIYVDVGLSIDVFDDGVVARNDAETMTKNEIAPFESAKIYLRTRDMSAISELGDYEAVNQTFTVSGTSSVTSLAIKVNNVGLQVGGVARQFYVEIYKVEITGLKEGYTFHQPNTTREISSKILSTGAEFSIGRKEKTDYQGDTLNVLDLDYYSHDISEGVCRDVTTNTWFGDVRINLANIGNSWYNKVKYLSDRDMLKLGIRATIAAYEEPNGIYVDNSFVGAQIFGGDSINVGAPALEGVPSKNIYTSDSVVELARWFAKFQSDEREVLTLSEAFNGEFEGVTVETLFNENVLIAKQLTEKDYQLGSKNYYGAGGLYDSYVVNMKDMHQDLFLIDDLDTALKGSTTISARFWSYLSSKKKLYEGSLMFIPTNYRAQVESATFGQIRKDENGKEKVGVSLRFSEPVQFKKYKDGREVAPYIEGYINGNAANALTFNYVSGEGTDTLFFEADVTSYKMNITRISLKEAHKFEDVYDFAANSMAFGVIGGLQHLNVMNKEFVNGWDKISSETYRCSYDLREPEIDINGNVSQTVKTAHTVTVRTTGISENGRFYYAWTTDDTSVPQVLFSEPISPQGYQTISSPSNISGTRYLYAVAVSQLGKQSEPKWYGPFYFDNDKPTLEVALSDDSYKQKTFKITVTNKTSTIESFDKCVELEKVLKVFIASDAEGKKDVQEFSASDFVEVDKNKYEITYTLTASNLLGEGKFGERYIFFSASDTLGNQGKTAPISYYFDDRPFFNVTLTQNDFEMNEFAGEEGLTLDKNYYTIDLSKMATEEEEDKTLVFSIDDSSISSMEVESFMHVNGKDDAKDCIEKKGPFTISINKKFKPGLYCLIVQDSGLNKRSFPIYFYVTNGKDAKGSYQEETGGYQDISNRFALTNKAFQIPNSIPYYYMTNMGFEKKKNYNSGKDATIFSSWHVAHSYILYYEYLDLYAVTLTENLADDLNSGNMNAHRKADGVKQKAEAGQVWIRYKEENWRPNSTTRDWVYYYYGEDSSTLPINTNRLSTELLNALNTVANMICSYGEDLDLVTEEYLDKYGAPTVKPEQMHLEAESSDVSLNGTRFAYPVGYLGDDRMHLFTDTDIPLSTNTIVPFGEHRYFYYKTDTETYCALKKDHRETLGEYFDTTGKITILEIDENGAREYCVYVDNSAPELTVSWTTGDGTNETEKKFSLNDAGTTISGNNFFIKGLEDYDALSFVAVYRYTSQGEGDLLYVYRKNNFEDGNLIRLVDGKYHVHVADRSGNGYIFTLQAKSELLDFTVKEVENSYIRVELNRAEEEVRYQVYLDGKLLTTNYSDRKFTESGDYRLVVEDIYGNKKEITIFFERDLPVVNWRYQIADGSYVPYDFEVDNERINIQKIDEQNYAIATSTYLRFLPLDGCTYEIISGNPNPNPNITSGWVALHNKTPFTMKVYYEAHPETYVTYTCIIDDSAPQISVSYEKEYYQAFEIKEIKEKLKKGELNLGDNPFIPTFIGFELGQENATTLYVANGQKVESKYFKVQVSDESGVKEVKIYCDGELVLTKQSNFSNIYLGRRGEYKIVATDNFGNSTNFSFVNDYEERVEYFVDGEQMSTDVSFADHFIDKKYTQAEYGNSQTAIRLLSSGEVHYLITGADGQTYHFAFVVEDGMIYTFQYVIKVVQGEKIDEETGELIHEIENISVRGAQALVSGMIAEIDEIGVAIYLSKNSDGTLLLTVRSTDSKQKYYTVETRISVLENQNEMPYYFKTEISTVPSSIEFVDEGNNLITASNTIKVNKSFAVRDTISAEIASVEVSFSRTGDYALYETVYDGTYYQRVFDSEGMYHVRVVNRYGVQTDYYVVISSQFVMSATVEYIDGTTIEYSPKYTQEHNDFYSNKSVEFVVYATNIKVSFDKSNAISVLPTEQGYTILYINASGRLEVEDEYGNKLEKHIFIHAKTFAINENMLKNFNEEALRRDENYTNNTIVINKHAIQENEVAFIAMLYGGKTISLYDSVSEVHTEFDENQIVGTLGDGEYTLIFKDRYGNKAERVIHYCGTPTLTILRNTLNGVGAEVYPLEDMLAHGVWTNDRVSFSISATEYILKVDGMENVTSIAYDTKTKNEYEVSYLDEYGFKYSFTVYLRREEVVIQPAESTSVTQIDDRLVTKDNLKLIFTKNAFCSYTLNNEPEKPYNVDDVLYKDGIYRFKVVDKAGNLSTYTVKKDSAVEYRLEGTGASEILINGGVTNGRSVKFYAENADNAYIKKVFHNNKFIEYNDETFTERGKWELIVADDAGNESYFRFYILYGKMDGFSYNTPYNYVITSVRWEMEDSSADASETMKEQGLRLEATENGRYTVTMQSSVTGEVRLFTFTIDKTPPQVELLGCQPNEKTINNITLKGCSVGDTIYVYKDGKLVKTVRIDSNYMDPPTIKEAGKYKIIVQNEAGIQTELAFERKYIPNVAGSVLIIVLALAAVIGLFVGLIWRNHSKTDD